jgi:hypothetical protein
LVLLKYFKLFTNIISSFELDAVINFSVPHFPPALAVHEIFNLMNKKSIFFWTAGLDGFVYGIDSLTDSFISNIYFQLGYSKMIELEMDKFLKLSQTPYKLKPIYMENIPMTMIKTGIAYLTNRLSLVSKRKENLPVLLTSIIYKNGVLKGRKYISFYDKNSSKGIPNEDYIYVPFHMQPEATSLPLGGDLHDHAVLLNYLLNSTPKNYKLVIKENPKQTYRCRNEYLIDLINNDRIIFVDRKTNTYDLILSSKAVISLTGTALLEASVLRKPVVVLGHSIYQLLPNSFSLEELNSVIESGPLEYELKTESFKKFINFLNMRAFTSAIIRDPNVVTNDEDITNSALSVSKVIDGFLSESLTRR